MAFPKRRWVNGVSETPMDERRFRIADGRTAFPQRLLANSNSLSAAPGQISTVTKLTFKTESPNQMTGKLTVACGLMALFLAGCADDPPTPESSAASEDGHDHDHGHDHAGHDHGQGHSDHESAQTFASAVEAMVGMRNTIRDGFAADDLDAAHGPLHDVGHTLATIESLAQKQGLEGESLTAVQDAVKVLKEKFAAVDQMMHGGEGSEYSEVSADVDAALAALVTASGADAAGGHTDKDHDH